VHLISGPIIIYEQCEFWWEWPYRKGIYVYDI
jgi:hypothetical protein